MDRFSLDRSIPRLLFCGLLLLLPLVTVWNLAVGPGRGIKIGPKLDGVTRELPLVLSWSSIVDGSFQKAAASRLTEAFALRQLLIRINNEIRFELFGALTAPQVVTGSKGQLFERGYIDEYCGRTEGQGASIAAAAIPKLRTIQDYYRAHGGVFVYMTSPSKVAYMPDNLLGHVSCPNAAAARTQFLSQYVDALKDAGINVVDGAGLIHGLRGHYDVDLFPQGGAHWNDLGSALAVSALVREINRQIGRELVPPFSFSYTLSRPASGADRELVDLLNVFFPPLSYLTPKVSYDQPASCDRAAAPQSAIIGSSFAHMLATTMIEHNCLAGLNFYYYARIGRFGGSPYRELQRNLQEDDLAPLRDAAIVIVEENESLLTRTDYVDVLEKTIIRR